MNARYIIILIQTMMLYDMILRKQRLQIECPEQRMESVDREQYYRRCLDIHMYERRN